MADVESGSLVIMVDMGEPDGGLRAHVFTPPGLSSRRSDRPRAAPSPGRMHGPSESDDKSPLSFGRRPEIAHPAIATLTHTTWWASARSRELGPPYTRSLEYGDLSPLSFSRRPEIVGWPSPAQAHHPTISFTNQPSWLGSTSSRNQTVELGVSLFFIRASLMWHEKLRHRPLRASSWAGVPIRAEKTAYSRIKH